MTNDLTANNSPISLSLQAERLAFDDFTLFEGVELELPAGAWTCLLGPSGVGKTTLLRLIAGLIPGAENISLHCSDNNPIEGRTAYMAQQDLLMPWLSVLENILLGAKLRGEAPDKAKALDLLDQVGLTANAESLPSSLSGGMRQRAALARTLMEDRPLVLMDEPFSSLDAISRVRMQDLAANLLTGRTVLLVTHDPLEALRLGDRIHVLSGRPVHIDDAFMPHGQRPRDLHDPDVLNGQADLLERLSAADQKGAA
ncbi:MAG: ABC transporter ATP-binding protein [Rhodospirillaceae bacterium]|jgi:putative hydroxymethylpyrimidine transport system ATP-binding protein|nr:ABC transporter ATP-binding protein [Rhodospirillaceae bacterium]MBT4590228.1 ABC transporter ATP-binding protein [Rhodospirillaceae bacterium]MBT4941135.1 ABC transporter ATP-binding protein [Rhodospirillaceae bacterium]MBT5939710.1 ABC transporter ATP-binding protein [Rhodospirillaceae bacterium]MBT7268740.1 ABC transporter ATP-binding protein [Rhodospirillaceae bacterium]